MSVTIGHASINELGKVAGGTPGDQTKKEVCTRSYYSKDWQFVLRPKDSQLAERSAQACEAACENNAYGYSQPHRNTAHTEAKKVGYDLARVTTPCETDCSAFMTLCAIAGGATELEYTGNAPTTSTMGNEFVKSGRYEKLTDPKYLTSDQYLKRGDILVKPGSHTVMVLDNGELASIVNPSIANTYPRKGIDVSKWNNIKSYTNLKAAGVQFGIIKIIDKSGNVESSYRKHLNGFLNAGIEVFAVYNYLYATTVEDAEKSARQVIRALNGDKYPVALDIEDPSLTTLGEKLADMIVAYQRVIESAGLQMILYTGMSFYNTYLKRYKNKLGAQRIWIARYPSSQPMTIDQNPDPQKKPQIDGVFMWQYSSTVRISEASNGNLDCNIMYEPLGSKPEPIQGDDKPIAVGYVNTHSLRVRSLPNTSGKVLGYLIQGQQCLIYQQDPETGWYRISHDQQWVSNKYIDIQK